MWPGRRVGDIVCGNLAFWRLYESEFQAFFGWKGAQIASRALWKPELRTMGAGGSRAMCHDVSKGAQHFHKPFYFFIVYLAWIIFASIDFLLCLDYLFSRFITLPPNFAFINDASINVLKSF